MITNEEAHERKKIGGEGMKLKLDRETVKLLRIKKRAEKAFRKLSERRGELSMEQRHSLKCVVARGLKEFPTNAEIKLKPHLLRMGFDHCKVILGYIPDFSHDRARVIVEVDGGVHDRPEVRERDRQKDAALRTAGWTVIRVTNGQVESDIAGVLRTITRVICHEAPSGG